MFDDTMFVLRVVDGAEQATVFPASLQYGFRASNLEQSRDVAPGVHKYRFGVHNPTGASLANQARLATEVKLQGGVSQWVDRATMPLQNGHSLPYRALKPFPTVPGFRDTNKDGRLDAQDTAGLQELGHNIHSGNTKEKTSGATGGEGCQVINGWSNYTAFMRQVEADHSLQGTLGNELAATYNGNLRNRPASDGSRPIIYTLIDTNFLFPCALPLGETVEARHLSLAPMATARQRLGDLMRRTEMTFAGGYFPLGKNNCWHSGLHLPANPGTLLHAPMGGEIVAFRLGQGKAHTELKVKYQDASGQEKELELGSHNFILMRHRLEDGAAALMGKRRYLDGQGKPVENLAKEAYSLYMHLGEPGNVNDDAKLRLQFPWLIHGYKVVVKFATKPVKAAKGQKPKEERVYDPLAKTYRDSAVPLDSGPRPKRGMIDQAKQNLVPLNPGDRFRVIKGSFLLQGGEPWMLIEKYYDAETGAELKTPLRLYALERLIRDPEKSEPLEEGEAAALLDRLRSGEVLVAKEAFGHKVEVDAGDPLWVTGCGITAIGQSLGFLHFSVFSLDPKDEKDTKDKRLFPDWPSTVDETDDSVVEDQELLAMVPQAPERKGKPLEAREIAAFYSAQPQFGVTYDVLLERVLELRKRAFKFQIEWAMEPDRQIAKLKPLAEAQGETLNEALFKEAAKPFLWWREIAAKVGLPEHGKVWHYNPLQVLWEVALLDEEKPPVLHPLFQELINRP